MSNQNFIPESGAISNLLSGTAAGSLAPSAVTPAAKGTVYLVGAGPGAVDLLTLRAARLLARADVVFHDALVNPEILALAPFAKLIAVGKRCGRFSTAQQFINRQLVRAAAQYSVIVRLKGGDPMLFGRAQEELDELHRQGIRTEVVAGVSAAFAASAELQQSLTQRGRSRSVTFVTPRIGPGEGSSDWSRAALAADTVALYMGGHQLAFIAQTLIAGGMPPARPAVIVAAASLGERQTRAASMAQLAAGEVDADFNGAPVLLLIGEVYGELLALAQANAQTQTQTQTQTQAQEFNQQPVSPSAEQMRFGDAQIGRAA